LVWIIDHRLRQAAAMCVICAAMTSVGLIHSPFSDGRIFLPWQGGLPALVHSLAIGYLLLGGLCGLLSFSNRHQAFSAKI